MIMIRPTFFFTFLALLFLRLGWAQEKITPETALSHYLQQADGAYKWEVRDSVQLPEANIYTLLLTSQRWQEIVWTHQLSIAVPKQLNHEEGLLFISGGSNKNGIPNWTSNEDDLLNKLTEIAVKNKACVAMLKQTPNQPLFNGLTEDALISYTLHRFQQEHDYSLPLLFPMVKSAVKAMDAVQEFADRRMGHRVQSFLVSGISKRGWTTWLTGASDSRVKAIAPMVIDILNMPVSLDYQIDTWKDYSIQIQDYVRLGIVQQTQNEEGQKLLSMIDPYSYRRKLTMPKMLFMGTNDEYWVVDNVKNYLDSIPGTNLLHYVPNVGHNLGDGMQALTALNAFFAYSIQGKGYPAVEWDVRQVGRRIQLGVRVDTDRLKSVRIWEARSNDIDFRDNVWLFRKPKMSISEGKLSFDEPFPGKGYKAFYLEFFFSDPTGGTYSQCSRVFSLDSLGLLERDRRAHLAYTLGQLARPYNPAVLVAAHRGLHHDHPENSIAAIKASIEQGVDIVEIDVKVSKDGIPFLLHDKTLNRTTNGKGDAEQMTWKQLSRLRLKHHDTLTDRRIPTLEEALRVAKGSILLDLDLKTDRIQPVIDLVKQSGLREELLFFDSDYASLKKIKEADEMLKLMPRAYDDAMADSAIRLFTPAILHLDENCYTDSSVRFIKDRGVAVWMNALGDIDKQLVGKQDDDVPLLEQLIQGGTNVIQTDEPQKLLYYLKKRGLR